MATTPPEAPIEQPSYFTLIDLLWELVLVGFVTGGCYVGWKIGNDFWAMLLGGALARCVGLALLLSIRARVLQNADKD